MSKERSPQHEYARPPSRFDRVVTTIAARTETLRDILPSYMQKGESARGERDMQPLIDAQEKLRGVMLQAPYTRELYLIDPTLRALARANDPHLAQFLSHTFSIVAASDLVRYGASSIIVDQAIAKQARNEQQVHMIDQEWLKESTPSSVIDTIVRQQSEGYVHLLGVGAALYGAHRQLLLSAEGGVEGVPMWHLPGQRRTGLFDRPTHAQIEAQIAAPSPTPLTDLTLTVGPHQPPPPPGATDILMPGHIAVPVWQTRGAGDRIHPLAQTIVVSGENTAQILRSEQAAHMDVLIVGHDGLRSALAAQAAAYNTITSPIFKSHYRQLPIESAFPKLTHMMDHVDVRTAQIMHAAMREDGEGLGVEVYDVPGLSQLRAKISTCTAF